MEPIRGIRVTVEASRTRKRVWLKTIESGGKATIVNIARADARMMRNRLLEKLCEAGYDQVRSPAIQLHRPPRRAE